MGYVASTKPRIAGPQTDSAMRSKAMSRRPRPANCLPDRLAAALKVLENWPGCKCPVSLMSICLIGEEVGCRSYNTCKCCSCKLRWLPSCLLKRAHGCNRRRVSQQSRKTIPECRLAHPTGCMIRQAGGICSCPQVPKPSCSCPLMQLPCCLAKGCHDRQEGHLCECPRGPAIQCSHMLDKGNRERCERAWKIVEHYAKRRNCDPYDFWATIQREAQTIKERLDKDKTLADPEPPGKPQDMKDRATSALILEGRADCGVGLWLPGDRRAPIGEIERERQISYLRNCAAFLKQLNVA